MSTVSRNSARPDNFNKLHANSLCFYPKMLVTLTVKSLNFALFFPLYAFHPSVVPFSSLVAGFRLRDGQSGTAQVFSVNNSVFPYAHYSYLIHPPPTLYRDLQGNRLSPLWVKNEIFKLLNSYLLSPLRRES